MKKFSLILTSLILLTLSACGNDEPNNEATSVQTLYHRVIDTQLDLPSPVFSQSTCQFTLRDEASRSLKGDIILLIDNTTRVEFVTDFMTLTPIADESYTYTFNGGTVTSGGHTISEIQGKLDLFGPIFIKYIIDGRYQCYTTMQPYYTHTLTDISHVGSSQIDYSTSKINYGLTINGSTMKGTLHLFGFHIADGTTGLYMLEYGNLKAEITNDGYHLTGEDIVPVHRVNATDYDGTTTDQYSAASIDVRVNEQGQVLKGTIIIGNNDSNQLKVDLSGQLFATNL